MNKRKLLLLGAIVAAIVVFFASGAQDYFTLQSLKASQSEFQALFAESPYKVAGTFFVVYVAMAALSLPGAALLTLLGAALFGFGWGLLLISFASTIGATLAFLISRTLLRESIEKRFRLSWNPSTVASSVKAASIFSRCAWCRSSRSSSSIW